MKYIHAFTFSYYLVEVWDLLRGRTFSENFIITGEIPGNTLRGSYL